MVLCKKTAKLTLQTHLTRNAVTPKTPSKHVVIDVGTLLHKFQWLWNSSYHDLENQYVKHLKAKHKNSDIHVVFDGCKDPLLIKAYEHFRREAISSANINITNTSM